MATSLPRQSWRVVAGMATRPGPPLRFAVGWFRGSLRSHLNQRVAAQLAVDGLADREAAEVCAAGTLEPGVDHGSADVAQDRVVSGMDVCRLHLSDERDRLGDLQPGG